ncbi:MAG: hypothetical protein PWQ96_1859 [Clostridia bacterium]|jgi:putative FmdB family regulatory protein|nr:putative regulatory protein FmdB family [Clostridiales bacterium]MDK2986215.1 hypothetical protein [Clostridia bacterium]
MPTYEFKCNKCQHKFTTRVSLNEKEKVECPECNSNDIEQIFTSFSFKTATEGGCSAPTGSPFS